MKEGDDPICMGCGKISGKRVYIYKYGWIEPYASPDNKY
jgi:hypothetical protein